MFEEHPHFSTPSAGECIWRFMSYTKFLACLNKNSLFFSRYDKLGDPFEGAYAQKQEELRQFYEAQRLSEAQRGNLIVTPGTTKEIIKKMN